MSSKLQGSQAAATEVERFAPFMFGILAATVVGIMIIDANLLNSDLI